MRRLAGSSFVRRAVLGLALAAQAAAAAAGEAGRLENRALAETSGLAASTRQADLLWAINDSGNAPQLFAVGVDGSDRGVVRLRGARNVDWEDLASFRLDGVSYLAVADVGDNSAQRERLRIYVIAEPQLAAGRRLVAGASPAWTIDFRFEDGARDCESVAVDAGENRVLLLSKRDKPPRLYRLPLRPPAEAGVLTARRIGSLPGLPRASARDLLQDPLYGAYRHQPTALDVDAHSGVAVVLTYQLVYLFRRGAGEQWEEALGRAPTVLGAHGLEQAESLALAAGGVLYVTSESRGAQLLRYALPAEDDTALSSRRPVGPAAGAAAGRRSAAGVPP